MAAVPGIPGYCRFGLYSCSGMPAKASSGIVGHDSWHNTAMAGVMSSVQQDISVLYPQNAVEYPARIVTGFADFLHEASAMLLETLPIVTWEVQLMNTDTALRLHLRKRRLFLIVFIFLFICCPGIQSAKVIK